MRTQPRMFLIGLLVCGGLTVVSASPLKVFGQTVTIQYAPAWLSPDATISVTYPDSSSVTISDPNYLSDSNWWYITAPYSYSSAMSLFNAVVSAAQAENPSATIDYTYAPSILSISCVNGVWAIYEAGSGSTVHTPSCVSYSGTSCSVSNGCGINYGTYNCSGTCSASAPVCTPSISCDPVGTNEGSVTVTGTTIGAVWGSGPYTSDSSVAAAAVHAGLLSPGQTGTIKKTSVGDASPYVGSTRNGVTTHNYAPSWCGVNISLVGPACTVGQRVCQGNDVYQYDSSCDLNKLSTCNYACSTGDCVAPPQPQFSVRPVLVAKGATSIISWNIQHVQSCTNITGNGDSWNPNCTATSGSYSCVGAHSTSAINQQTTYSLSCTDLTGAPVVINPVQINVAPNYREL